MRPAPVLPSADPAPLVCTVGTRRTLEFTPGDVQSEMLVTDPTRLMLSYCRAIMCFALFVPQPRHILLIGLGGGSLLKFCYRHFPHARITVLEVRADVIALRAQFAVPPDDARLCVVHADAAGWLAQRGTADGNDTDGPIDVLVVDGFDRSGLPAALGSARFYADCRRALADGGVLVANIFSYDPQLPGMLARLSLMFDGRVCALQRAAGNNRILFAVKAAIAPVPVPRALRLQRWATRAGGIGLLEPLLARAVVAWIARRAVPKDNR